MPHALPLTGAAMLVTPVLQRRDSNIGVRHVWRVEVPQALEQARLLWVQTLQAAGSLSGLHTSSQTYIVVRIRCSNAIPNPAVHVAAAAIARSVLLSSLCWTQLTRSRGLWYLSQDRQDGSSYGKPASCATTRVADPLKLWAGSGSYRLRGACFSVLPASAWAYVCQYIQPR